MKRFLFPLLTLSILACGDSKKQIDVAGISPSPFIGYWEIATDNDSIKKLSLYIGERNDSLLVAFYWERKNPDYITESPFKDSNGDIIPHACLATPKSGNTANGTFANSRMNHFYGTDSCNYAISLELKSNNTLIFKTEKPIGNCPDSAVMVRIDYISPVFTDDLSHFYK